MYGVAGASQKPKEDEEMYRKAEKSESIRNY